MSVEINGTIYAGEKAPLAGLGGEPGWRGRARRGSCAPWAAVCQRMTHTTCLALKAHQETISVLFSPGPRQSG